jgi:hypothetical protein
MNKRIIAKEWLIFIAGFSFGILILPPIVILFLGGLGGAWSLENFENVYKALFDKRDFAIAWLIVFAPYLFIQIGRATAWSVKQLKQK